LRHLVEFQGTQQAPVKKVTLKGFVFRHAARTFMETKEPLLRSDWTIYRGGAVMLTGTEDVSVIDSEFDQLGGNAVFVNNYNRRTLVKGCHIHDSGASGICFVGDPNAVRNPLFEYNQSQDLTKIDRTPGPKSDNYPADSVVEDCLIHGIGRVERQPAGVQIAMSRKITVRDTSIYDCARAGINIGDGTWGGHLIERCDVFETVLETGEHGSFNSWGRDRFWTSNHRGVSMPEVKKDPKLPFFDAIDTTVKGLKSGGDANSISGDPMFIDPAAGDFRVEEGSPALKMGFKNFPMDQFGVKKPSLKAIVRTPVIPVVSNSEAIIGGMSTAASYWLGVRLHGLEGEEFSAFGVTKADGGVQLVDVPANSPAAKAGLKSNDLIQALNDRKITGTADLLDAVAALGDAPLDVRVIRNQQPQSLSLRQAPFIMLESAEQAEGLTKLVPSPTPTFKISASTQPSNDPLSSLIDGKLATGYGAVFSNIVRDGAYRLDLLTPKPVGSITSWSFNQEGVRGRQRFTIYGSESATDPGWNTADKSRFTALGTIDTRLVPPSAFQAASLRARPGQSLGTFRWIVWSVSPVTAVGENSAFQELKVDTAR